MKKCSRCKQKYALSGFYKNKAKPSGRQGWCKECCKETSRTRYKANPQIDIQRSARSKQRLLQEVRELKQVPCVDCQQEYPPYVMHFDHVGSDKIANISNLVARGNRQVLWAEMAKCEIVCANCHAERTFQRRLQSSE